MKNISIIGTFFLCFIFGTVKAQVVKKHSHHLYLGYSFRNSFKSGHPGWFVGPVVAGYRYAIGKRLTLGVDVGYAMGKTDAYYFVDHRSSPKKTLKDRMWYSVFAAGLRFDYHYVNRANLDIYSGIAVDIYDEYQKFDEYPAYNNHYGIGSPGLCFIGCRYMVTPKVGVYSELGFRIMGKGLFGASLRL